MGYEDPVSYFLRPVYVYNQIERYGDLSTSNSNRIETVYRPTKRRKKTKPKKNVFMSTDESLDDLILENVLKQILNSSYHRKYQQSRLHLQKPQVNHHIINKIRIPPQFPHYELNSIKSPNTILNKAPYYKNDNDFLVKSHNSKVRPGNGVEFVKSNVHHIKHHNKVPLQNINVNPVQYNKNSDEELSDDSMLNYVTGKLIEIGLRQVNNKEFVDQKKHEIFANTISDAIIEDIPTVVTPNLPKINNLIEKYNIRNNLATAAKHPIQPSKYNLKFAPNDKHVVETTKSKVNQNHYIDKYNNVQVYEPPNLVDLGTYDEKVVEKGESSLLNRITTEGLKFALSKINNLVFDGEKYDENLADTISTTIIHDIPNLLLPTLPKIPNIFQNAFKDSKNAQDANKTTDLKTSASNILPTALTPTKSDDNFRYVFLLGVVPAIVGSFLAIGAQPLQAMLVGAYVVTTYLFFVEKTWRSKRGHKKIGRGDYSNEIEEIESIFSNAIEKFLKLTNSRTFLRNYNSDRENNYKNANKITSKDLMIHKYFNYSDQLTPLLNLMDGKTIMYLKTFDDIMYDLVTSLQ